MPSRSRLRGRVRAAERQRAVRHPAVEQSGLLQILDEERQLAQRRHKPAAVPLDMHPTGKCLRRRGKLLYRWLFTPRVRQKRRKSCAHAHQMRRFGPSGNHPTAGFSPLSLNSLHLLRQIPSNHGRNDGCLGEPSGGRGRGAPGLGRRVRIRPGDTFDDPDIAQSSQLPRQGDGRRTRPSLPRPTRRRARGAGSGTGGACGAGAGFRSITENIDTTTPAGRMMMQMVGSFAEFERAMIRERTSAGIAAARAEGRIGGRRKKLDAAKRREIAESVITGRKSGAEMARLYNISQPTVSRIVAQHRMASL